MTSQLPPLNALRAFESAARQLSISGAARELFVTPAAVSHQVKALEAFVGTALFVRRHRQLALTEAGATLLPGLRSGFAQLTEAVAQLRSQQDDQQISAHLLVPGWTTTGKNEHRQGAWLPDQVADFMLDALKAGSFYILCPDDDVSTEMDHKRILWAAKDIINDRPPLSRWHPDFEVDAKKACS